MNTDTRYPADLPETTDALDCDDPYAQNGLAEFSGPRCPLQATRTLTIDRKHIYRWFDPRRWLCRPTLSVSVSN